MRLIKNISPARIQVHITIYDHNNQVRDFPLQYGDWFLVPDNMMETKSIIIQKKKGNVEVKDGYGLKFEPYIIYNDNVNSIVSLSVNEDLFEENAVIPDSDGFYYDDDDLEITATKKEFEILSAKPDILPELDDLFNEPKSTNQKTSTTTNTVTKNTKSTKQAIKEQIIQIKKDTYVVLNGKEDDNWKTLTPRKTYKVIEAGKDIDKNNKTEEKWVRVKDDKRNKIKVFNRAVKLTFDPKLYDES